MRKLLSLICIFTLCSFIFALKALASDRFFEIQSIDTMKYSRDAAANGDVTKQIPRLVKQLSGLGATHIAIGTPYNEDFYPVIKKWVDEIRKHNMNVWFRGNFAEWEGWFNHEKFTNPDDHHAKTYSFITSHPELFREGDIFTPVPEPENGGHGDPRRGEDIKQKFFNFLLRSYENCQTAFRQIGVNVSCGYFSVNGDVAKLFTKDIVERTGGVLVVDHYVKTPEKLVEDILYYNRLVQAPIVLGEYGAPIPDIHGDLSEKQQAELIRDNLKELAKMTDIAKGINYWTAYGGSTSLFNGTQAPREAASVVDEYFRPLILTGVVTDEFGSHLQGVKISAGDLPSVESDREGRYRLITTSDYLNIQVEKDGFYTYEFSVQASKNHETLNRNIELERIKKDFWYNFFRFIRQLFVKK